MLDWQQAWHEALYGGPTKPDGFFAHQRPATHFRTNLHAGGLEMAYACLEIVRRFDLRMVVDVGAGGGELLVALNTLNSNLALVGVEVAQRPTGLPEHIAWSNAVPPVMDRALLLGHEFLDNVAVPVVQLTRAGRDPVWRRVQVDIATGQERLAAPVEEAERAWLQQWWPTAGLCKGARAEVGLAREELWQELNARLTSGVSLVVDYGHTVASRPLGGSLASFRGGRQIAPTADGTADLTAAVAMDALAARLDGRLVTQREALRHLLWPTPARQAACAWGAERALSSQETLGALAADSRRRALCDPEGLGGYWWMVTTVGTAADALAGWPPSPDWP